MGVELEMTYVPTDNFQWIFVGCTIRQGEQATSVQWACDLSSLPVDFRSIVELLSCSLQMEAFIIRMTGSAMSHR